MVVDKVGKISRVEIVVVKLISQKNQVVEDKR